MFESSAGSVCLRFWWLVYHRLPPEKRTREGAKFWGGAEFWPPLDLAPPHPWEAVGVDLSSVFIGSFEWRRPGSNRQPPACKAGALPVELRPRRCPPGHVVRCGPGPQVTGRTPSQSGRKPVRGKVRRLDTVPPQPAPVGTRGFEPRTSALSELRSNQLSYAPVETGAGILAHPRFAVQPAFPTLLDVQFGTPHPSPEPPIV
jgi:hypothetical protein